MQLEELINATKQFCEQRDWDQFHNPKELAIGLSTEANELLAIFRFLSESQMQEALKHNKEAIADEVADVLFFLLRFVQLHQIDIVDAFYHKLEKNNQKYPIDKAKGNNLKYNQEQ